ncbi:MAG: RagB/SusD family nutrient uptake outer membrane protein, partial [Bacteroidales bacterium]|nr:RagB/SusD family nutrient uptake outer membrane protein [Bacteroidales bacterium]
MNRKIKIYSFSVALLIGLLIFACNKEWLDTKPIGVESEETFYSNMTAADMAVTTCYSIFNLEKVWDLSIVMTMGSIASDEAECGAGGKDDVPEYQHIDQLSHTANEAQVFDWTWGYAYRAVGACNLALEKLPKISAETDPNFNATLMQKRLGEVYFLRAFNYFYLTLMYGGVPLVDHTLTPAEYNIKRNEISEVFGLIKSDLTKAITSLPLRSGWGDQVGRASKGAAQAMMAKVYLYESSYAKYYPNDSRFAGLTQHWDSAAYWAEQVIASDEYQLIGINGERFDTWRG